MSIVVRCPECGAALKFRDDALGKKGKCAKCKTVVQVLANGERHQNPEDDDAGFVGNLSDAVAGESRTGHRTFKPNPESDSAPRNEPAPAEESGGRALLTARPRVRVIVLIALLIPIVVASRVSLTGRLLSCFIPLMLTGTYRTSRIRGDRFITKFHLGFFPVVTHRCKLRAVTHLNVKYGREGSGWGTFLLLGPMQVVLGRGFDFLIPSIGGPYQIHLVTAKGRELVAWQGFKEPEFRSTLDLLTSLTKAELRAV